MLFSILIAHYNNFEYFKECYQSILLQSYKNFEIILINDGSSDNSTSIIENYINKYDNFRLINK